VEERKGEPNLKEQKVKKFSSMGGALFMFTIVRKLRNKKGKKNRNEHP